MLNKYYSHPIVHICINLFYKCDYPSAYPSLLSYSHNQKDYTAYIHALIDGAKVDFCNCIETHLNI